MQYRVSEAKECMSDKKRWDQMKLSIPALPPDSSLWLAATTRDLRYGVPFLIASRVHSRHFWSCACSMDT